MGALVLVGSVTSVVAPVTVVPVVAFGSEALGVSVTFGVATGVVSVA